MIPPFDSDLIPVRKGLAKIGMRMVADRDYIARFENDQGWALSLETERYDTEGYNFFLVSPDTGVEYSILLLQEVHHDLFGSERTQGGLDEDVGFIIDNWGFLTREEGRYAPLHQELNLLPWGEMKKRLNIN